MKILCRANVTSEIMGFPSMEAIKAACEEYPHLRPCAKREHGEKLGGWVYKKQCARGRCKFFVKVIYEEGDKKEGAALNLQESPQPPSVLPSK